MVTQNMRPTFHADTCYIPVHGGVYFRNNSNGLVLKGKSLYLLLEHLVPNLKGNATLEEITEGLDQDRKKMVTNLIEKLRAHHFLKDASQDQSHTLHPALQATYSSDITFITSFPTSTTSQFEQLRAIRLLLSGSGHGFSSLIQASLQCGVRQIDVIATPEHAINAHFPSDIPDLSCIYDSEQVVRAIDAPRWDNEAEVRHMIEAYDAILHFSDQPMLARARLLNKLCVEQQKTFIQAIVLDNYAWIGPLVGPDTEGCWECAWRRLQSNLAASPAQRSLYAFHDQPADATSQLLTMSTATITANRLVFELFKYRTQAGFAKTAGMLTAIDLKTFLSKSHAFLPHPHCQACQHPSVHPTITQFREQIQASADQAPLDPDTFFAGIGRCVDDTLGLFTALGDDNFVQAPLTFYQVRLSNPMPTSYPGKPLDVVAVSIGTMRSRLRACQQACERYAAHFVDHRRLLSHETIQQHTLPALSSDQLIGMQPVFPAIETWIGALDLHTQQEVLVPATQVFSSLHATEQAHERGIASGTSWEEAICQALVDQCNDLTVEHLSDAQHPFPQIDLASVSLTPEGTYLLHLLEVADRQITVYDVTGPLRVPTFAFCSHMQVIAYRSHYDVAQALDMGFEQLLQQYQAAQYRLPTNAITPVPDLPSSLRGDQLCVPHYTLPETWSARLQWLLQQLQTNGLRALAIPLDHDPALRQILPFIVRVLLTRAEV